MIRRDPEQAQSRSHDLIVIGVGIYGVAMTLEAARRGLRVVLLERDAFGWATTCAPPHRIAESPTSTGRLVTQNVT